MQSALKSTRLLMSLGLALAAPLAGAITLVPLTTEPLNVPVFLGHAGDGSHRLFVLEKAGLVKVLQRGAKTATTFLDIRAQVASEDLSRGLLGLAFHPHYATNGRFFVFYTRRSDGALVIAGYRVSADPNLADTTETVLLVIPHAEYTNNNGGMLAFGPDGYLYAGIGDGGGANDPSGNAQNLNVLLGKILRIDVDRPDAAAGTAYSAPPDNPFVGKQGRPEIFAYGWRNPWRLSFDRLTGQPWVSDVGEAAEEEVNTPLVKGGNYGWRVYEGSHCTGLDPDQCTPTNFEFPRFEYGHTAGRCAIIGGYVYRGARRVLPSGTYVYGDYCTGEILAWDGAQQSVLLHSSLQIASFGEDEAGELYVLGLDGTVNRIAASPGCRYEAAPQVARRQAGAPRRCP